MERTCLIRYTMSFWDEIHNCGLKVISKPRE